MCKYLQNIRMLRTPKHRNHPDITRVCVQIGYAGWVTQTVSAFPFLFCNVIKCFGGVTQFVRKPRRLQAMQHHFTRLPPPPLGVTYIHSAALHLSTVHAMLLRVPLKVTGAHRVQSPRDGTSGAREFAPPAGARVQVLCSRPHNFSTSGYYHSFFV